MRKLIAVALLGLFAVTSVAEAAQVIVVASSSPSVYQQLKDGILHACPWMLNFT